MRQEMVCQAHFPELKNGMRLFNFDQFECIIMYSDDMF